MNEPPTSGSLTVSTIVGTICDEPDNIILKEEIQQMDLLLSSKEKIIKQAALTLEASGKYSDDISIICTQLKLLWQKSIAPSTINKALPEKYKRPYEKKLPETPDDLLEEILFRFQDENIQTTKILSSLIKKVKSDENTKKLVLRALTESIHSLHSDKNNFILHTWNDQISKITDLPSLLKFIKSQQINLTHLEKMIDWRQQLDEFMKIRIKMMYFTEHLAKIGDTLHYSAKWISKINRDRKAEEYSNLSTELQSRIERLKTKLQNTTEQDDLNKINNKLALYQNQLDKLKDKISLIDNKTSPFKVTDTQVNLFRNCPACDWNMADWFNKANIAEHAGEEIRMPKKRVNKLK